MEIGTLRISLPRLPRFQLRSLFVLVFSIAVGLAVVTAKLPPVVELSDEPGDGWGSVADTTSWPDEIAKPWLSGAWAAVATWCVLGLLHQSRDIWRALRRSESANRDETFAWQFALFWRLAVICLLVGYLFIDWLLLGEIISLPERDGSWGFRTAEQARDTLFYFAVLIAIGSRHASIARKSTVLSAARRATEFAAWTFSLALCLIALWGSTIVDYLVYLAITGIEHAQRFPLEGVDPSVDHRRYEFFLTTVVAAALVPVNFLLIHQLASRGKRWTRRSAVASTVLFAGLAVTLSYSVWLWTKGLFRLSPWLDEATFLGPWHHWLTACALVLVVVTTLAYRLAVLPAKQRPIAEVACFLPHHTYYHIGCWLSLSIVMLCLFAAISTAVDQFDELTIWVMLFVVEELLYSPPAQVMAATFLIALANTWNASRKSDDKQRDTYIALPPGRFFTFWTLSFLTIVFGALPLVWFIFASWLTPWYRLPLLDMDPLGYLFGQ